MAMGSCLGCRQEWFLAQLPGPHARPTAAVLHVLPLQYLFPTSMLWLTQQGISEISVIIYHFVQGRISLESIV